MVGTSLLITKSNGQEYKTNGTERTGFFECTTRSVPFLEISPVVSTPDSVLSVQGALLPTSSYPMQAEGLQRGFGGDAAQRRSPPSASALGSYTLIDTVCKRSEKFSDLSRLLTAVRKDARLRQYYCLSRSFVDYLRTMDSMGINISGFNNRDNKGLDKYFVANHRWTVGYRKKLLAKLYLLDEYIRENPSSITLMTLTVYQDGDYSEQMTGEKLTIPHSFNLLKKAWKKLSMVIRKVLPDNEYIWIVEPHKSGYPHLHVVLFSDVPLGIQEKIKMLWSEKYQAGSFENGVDFEIRRPDQAIESLRNYLMKYIAKGFISTESRYGIEGWTASELVFNSCVWDGGYRTFQPSRGLQKYLGWIPEKDDKIYWSSNTASIEDAGGEKHSVVIWEKSLVGFIPGRQVIVSVVQLASSQLPGPPPPLVA